MAANPIYVETEEEIPEVVERLRRVSGEETMVVLPTRSRIGQSRFNLQLLRNYASRLASGLPSCATTLRCRRWLPSPVSPFSAPSARRARACRLSHRRRRQSGTGGREREKPSRRQGSRLALRASSSRRARRL